MAAGEMSNLCLICGLPARLPSDDIDPSKEHKSGESTFFPGCEGSLILNERLRMYFTISKLLKFSERQCIKLLKSVSSHVQLCFCCGGVVNEAVNYHLKVLELKSKIAELGTALRSKRKEREGNGSSHCDEEDELGNTIRGIMCSDDECDAVNTRIVKVETDANDFQDDTATGDGLQSFFGDGGNQWSDTELALQNKTDIRGCHLKRKFVGVSRRKKLKRGLHEEASDSDSDYEPSNGQNTIRDISHVRSKSGQRRRINPRMALGRFLKGSRYHCEHCKSTYDSMAGFKKHLIAHRESKVLGNKFDCSQCGHPNLSEEKLRRHLVKVHEKLKNTCTICGHVAARRGGHEKHMLIQHNIRIWTPISEDQRLSEHGGAINGEGLADDLAKLKENISCLDLKLDLQGDIDVDRIPQTSSINENNECMQLPSESLNCRALQRTSTPKASESKEFICGMCESVYTTIQGFKKHMKVHDKSKQLGNIYDCPKCCHPNLSEEKLRRHVVKIHEKNKNTCKICGHFGHSRWIHEKHMLTKHGIKIWTPISEQKTNGETNSSTAVKSEFCEAVTSSRNNANKFALAQQEKEPRIENSYEKQSIDSPVSDIVSKRDVVLDLHEENSSIRQQRRTTKAKPTKLETDISEDEDNNKIETDDSDWVPPADGNSDADATRHSYMQDNDSHLDVESKKSSKVSTKTSSGLYFCEKCNVTYKSLRGYEKHKLEHLASAEMNHKYDCKACSFPCSSDRRLRYHKKHAHQEISKYPCKICGHQALKPSLLKLHMRKHNHNPNSRTRAIGRPKKYLENVRDDGKLVCLICKTCYTTPEGFARHMDEHKRSEAINGEFDCNTCHFPCLTESRLRRHKNAIHGKSLPTCQICNRTFQRPNLLRTHLKSHREFDKCFNPKIGKYSCQFCDSSFTTFGAIQTHQVLRHAEELEARVSVLCSHCGKRYYSDDALRKHIRRVHEKLFKFTCDICGKGFDNKTGFNSHKVIHDEIRTRNFVCEKCGVAYSHKKTLQSHIARFHPNPIKSNEQIESKEIGEHRCKWCNEVFPYKYTLVHHIRTHKELYNFECNVCGKSYISRSSLRLHKEVSHSSGENKFSCEYCGKVFQHKHYVICHYKFCKPKKELSNSSSMETSSTKIDTPCPNLEEIMIPSTSACPKTIRSMSRIP